MRVLIAEDERVLADVVAVGLRKEAMAVDVVYDGDAALEPAMTNDYDVIGLSRCGITLDPARHEVFRDGWYVALSQKEFAVLEVLLRAEGAVVSAEDLLEKAWDENINYFTNSVRVTLGTLRKKLGDPPVIETVTGTGYRI
ncbi:DNA-binding response regulator [Nonomuraea sp. NPDC049141]|uniref:response regulator transcription factor n=1 Tax=Nonomuraea sp. NPDC049141 TaxID=3155500 RepID=UPI0033C53787